MKDGRGQLHNNKRIRGDPWWKARSHDSATWSSDQSLVVVSVGTDTVDSRKHMRNKRVFKKHREMRTEALRCKAKTHHKFADLAYYNVLMQSTEQDLRVIKHSISQREKAWGHT